MFFGEILGSNATTLIPYLVYPILAAACVYLGDWAIGYRFGCTD